MIAKHVQIATVLIMLVSLCIGCRLINVTQSQVSTQLEVIILNNGIYDSATVLSAIEEYSNSLVSSGIACSISRLPQEHNTPHGIDEYIEDRYSAGIKLFILVGNDLRWPLTIGDMNNVAAASPADGVLCDTDGEVPINDGLHEPVVAYEAEVTVSYVFPPKQGITVDTQISFVAKAFNKFAQYHQGKLAYTNKGVICGRFNPDPWSIFYEATERMASASRKIFGNENTLKKELSSSEVQTYLEQAPAFFGVAGHGSSQVVETSSSGDLLSYANLMLSGKAPLLMEIFGCWVSGWQIIDENNPWCASRGFLSEAGIFENPFNIAMLSGNPGPESTAYHSFSDQVLSEIPARPNTTIGELMIGKIRRSTDWILFGDPTVRLDYTGGDFDNQPPIAFIDSISPNPAEKGARVYFTGSAVDGDGTIIGYRWVSSLDGELSRTAAFSTFTLSEGVHNIYFSAQDDWGDWSTDAVEQITITSGSELTILSPVDGETLVGTTVILVSTVPGLTAVNFYIDDVYKGYDTTPPYEYHWDTMLYANGEHEIQAKAYSRHPIRTYSSEPITVALNNALPSVVITSPPDGSSVSGVCLVCINAENEDKVSRVRFYVDDVLKGYDYSPPFQWNWDTTTCENGPHLVHVDAYYGNLYQYISSQYTAVTVNNTQGLARAVRITSLFDGVASGTVIVDIEATGEDLNRVYLYVDGQWKGYSTTYPYEISLNTLTLSNGPHEIYAAALYEERPPYTIIESERIIINVNNSV